MRVLEYRLLTRLDRSRAYSLGAALVAAGFTTNCGPQGHSSYGAPCTPLSCSPPESGGSGGFGGLTGLSGTAGAAGESGQGGAPSAEGGDAGEGTVGGVDGVGGAAGEGGSQ